MNQKEQLESLSRSGPTSRGGRKRNLGSLLLLLAFVAGVSLVFLLVFGNRLRPRVPVTVVSAVLLESDEAVAEAAPEGTGSMLAQASGWIEPDPFPIHVPVKVDGFVEEVFVYAGDAVEEGQLLATLDPTNFVLRVERLTASLEEALSDRTMAEAEMTTAQARHHEADDRLRRIRTLDPGDVSEVEIVAAERAETETRSTLEARLADLAGREAQVATIRAELAQAKVDLDRTTVASPMDGIVLRRFAAPGMKRMTQGLDIESATILSLYDPERLQVRVDVPLSDAGRLFPGMSARVVTAALAGQTFAGHITRITGEADITRNTLQVKVALEEPDPALRPEMLCRVEFFESPAGGVRTAGRGRQVWLPEEALGDGSEGMVTVWVVDPVNETVSPREIEVGAARRNGFRVIHNGLRAGEQVVVDDNGRLRPGSLVTVRED